MMKTHLINNKFKDRYIKINHNNNKCNNYTNNLSNNNSINNKINYNSKTL